MNKCSIENVLKKIDGQLLKICRQRLEDMFLFNLLKPTLMKMVNW